MFRKILYKHTMGSYTPERKTNLTVGLPCARGKLCHTFDLHNHPGRLVIYEGIAVTRGGLESKSH